MEQSKGFWCRQIIASIDYLIIMLDQGVKAGIPHQNRQKHMLEAMKRSFEYSLENEEKKNGQLIK